MEFAVDIILLLVFASMLITGIVKGFVKSVLGMIAMAAAFFLAYQFSAVLAPVIYERFLSERVFDLISKNLVDASGATAAAKQASAVITSIPEFVINIAASLGIDTNGITEKINGLDNKSTTIARELTDTVASPIITAVTHAILFALLLALIYILLMIIVRLIDKFFKLPFLKTANRLLGGVLGAVKGVILVFLLCVLFEIIAGIGKESVVAQAVDSSKIVSFINENNFVLKDFNA